ncbi:MAG TPA: DNA gyrase inhibitor YacG [Blastocatellia bacterium]|nr:DNA gyrase inhibitor YacG [Blastocatellia bacterium]
MRCPLCRREFNREESEWRPFCSERCQIIDLGNWASESYRISDKNDDDSTHRVSTGANEESEFEE